MKRAPWLGRVVVALVLSQAGGGPLSWAGGLDAALRHAVQQAWAGAPAPRDALVWPWVREDALRRDYAPRYVRGRPPYGLSPEGAQIVALLGRAGEWGLDPAAYALAARSGGEKAACHGLELAIALAWARFVVDGALGQPDAAPLAEGFTDRAAQVSLVLRRALAYPDPRAALAAVEPDWPSYRALRAALALWRGRERTPPGPWPPGGHRLRQGEAWVGLPQLAQRLGEALDEPVVGGTGLHLEGPVLAALRRFQARYGLRVDGVFGPQTRAALDVPAAIRIRQIEWALERLRWLGPMPRGRFVLINLPEYRLWLYENGQVVDTMAVIVGRPDWPTPILRDEIVAVELNPAWHVPPSVAARELYGQLVRDPHWLREQHMVLQGARGQSGPALRRALALGEARLRQRPGPHNALGRLRCVMANRHAVFLHDTPAPALFEQPVRALSHGCIRVQAPWALLGWLLQIDRAAVTALREVTLASSESTILAMPQPVQVLLTYATARLAPDGGGGFVPDVYDWDRWPIQGLGSRLLGQGRW